jgi:hypothetical protein
MPESSSTDLGVITALLTRFETQRLPILLELKEKVDSGQPLNDADLEFLERIFDDARTTIPKLEKHPEMHQLMARAIRLYEEITTRALENEKSK